MGALGEEKGGGECNPIEQIYQIYRTVVTFHMILSEKCAVVVKCGSSVGQMSCTKHAGETLLAATAAALWPVILPHLFPIGSSHKSVLHM